MKVDGTMSAFLLARCLAAAITDSFIRFFEGDSGTVAGDLIADLRSPAGMGWASMRSILRIFSSTGRFSARTWATCSALSADRRRCTRVPSWI